jgi:SNF2 family DNA or RNA helicase
MVSDIRISHCQTAVGEAGQDCWTSEGRYFGKWSRAKLPLNHRVHDAGEDAFSKGAVNREGVPATCVRVASDIDRSKGGAARARGNGMLHHAFGKRALPADEIGFGKTIQAIAASELLARLKNARRGVCPASLNFFFAAT